MVEHMGEGVLTLSGDGTILYANARFAEMLERSTIDLIDRSLASFVASDDRALVQSLLDAQSWREECRLVTQRGTEVPVQLSSTALTVEGGRTMAVVVSELTPERLNKAIYEANLLKDEFLATLSHELRTPLNIILGWTRMLLTGQLSPDATQHALELVEKNARTQSRLVSDLVDMSRVATGTLRVELQVLPIVPALEAAIDSVRLPAEAKEIAIDRAWLVENASVLADPVRLQQILWNLLSNAVKFTPVGGHVGVSAMPVADAVKIEIADSGIGIDHHFVSYVFDRFRQAEAGPTRGYGGLGLGLAIVRDLVRLHHGVVAANSAGLGRGATFSVTLPSAGTLAPRTSGPPTPQ
ncbi:MAG TPA: HAMP domain-containing sensor histidine kinase [Vicinamibacterales bacterium]|jgi:PAS domain S-box-containing protein